MECFRSQALKLETTSTAPISSFCETRGSEVLSGHIFHFTFLRCLYFFQVAALWHAHAACMKLLAVHSWQKVMNRATVAFVMIHFSLTSWAEVALKLLLSLKVILKSALWH